jgi:hypothetical protein
MGILGWLGKNTDDAMLKRCEDTLNAVLLTSEADATYINVTSIAVSGLFERLFGQQVNDPVEFLITLQSEIEAKGPDHAATLSSRIFKSISKPNTPPTVAVGLTLIAAWLQLVGFSQRTGGSIAMDERAWKLLGSYQSLFLRMARQPEALPST